MICKNTVGVKIHTLQHKKKKIAGDIIQTDESVLNKLNQDDIRDLFSSCNKSKFDNYLVTKHH